MAPAKKRAPATAKKRLAAASKKAAKKTTAKSKPAVRRRRAPKPPPLAVPASVIEATTNELQAIGEKDPRLAQSALAAAALELARQMDASANSATSKSMCARELRETMSRLRDLLPVETEGDRVDELSARRADRLTRRAAP